MNFLAHAYLSFGQPNILIGNLIADVVRGKQINDFDEGIRKGIQIHRLIDTYTDNHPVTMETKGVFSQSAGRYSRSFLDVSYDHFLAIDTSRIPDGGWKQFATQCYTLIEKHADILPSLFANMYIYMRSEDWLANYHHKWMIERSFDRLKRRASYLDDDMPVFNDFEKHYRIIQDSYHAFFPDLEQYVKEVVADEDYMKKK